MQEPVCSEGGFRYTIMYAKQHYLHFLGFYSPAKVDRIWGIWGSYYNIPTAIFFLLKGVYTLGILLGSFIPPGPLAKEAMGILHGLKAVVGLDTLRRDVSQPTRGILRRGFRV